MTGFKAEKTATRYVQKCQAPPGKVFPLLCPVREYEWIEPWRCELLRSDSGIAERNCVFRARLPGEASDDVWVISRYEPDSRIDFVRVNALRAMCYSIALADNGDGTTDAVFEQLHVGLNEEGNRSLHGVAGRFAFEMRIMGAMLDHYLATGTMLPLREALARVSTPG